ncbi:hypothetical protein BDY24DRAFT_34056 [Mrakia frigida]|uniref:uncharacterized protein n=1 Tax=Mrakia frigida TaxID=29902 RepID=UPI003FCC00D3
MSYPSLNASSKALPPPSPNKKRLLPSFTKRRSSSHDDLPMQAPPRPIQQVSPPSSYSTPTLGSGAQIVSTPEEALNAWRRESIDMRNQQQRGRESGQGFFDSERSLSQSSSQRNSTSNNQQLPSPPSSSVGRSRTYSISAPTPTLPAPLNPSSFTATLLSSKSVKLPRQPFPAVEQGDQSTLVQLQIAGQTFIIPLANLQRSSSNLAHFVHACLDIDNEIESDEGGAGGGTSFSETDDDEGRGTSQRWSSDS